LALDLTPGVYTFQMGISIGDGTTVTFDAEGDSDAVFTPTDDGEPSKPRTPKVLTNSTGEEHLPVAEGQRWA
jgi:hypothetical protein